MFFCWCQVGYKGKKYFWGVSFDAWRRPDSEIMMILWHFHVQFNNNKQACMPQSYANSKSQPSGWLMGVNVALKVKNNKK